MKKVAIRLLANMVGIYLASLFFPSISISSVEAIFWGGFVLGLVNLLVRPLLLLIAFPINLLTLGLFTLVINALMVMLATHLTSGIYVPSFLLALATSFVISITNIILDRVLCQ